MVHKSPIMSYLPVWFAGGGLAGAGSYLVNPVWCLLMAILPIVVTAVFYCAGAMAEKRKKEAQAAREAEVERIREEQKREAEERAKKAEEARKIFPQNCKALLGNVVENRFPRTARKALPAERPAPVQCPSAVFHDDNHLLSLWRQERSWTE